MKKFRVVAALSIVCGNGQEEKDDLPTADASDQHNSADKACVDFGLILSNIQSYGNRNREVNNTGAMADGSDKHNSPDKA